MDNITHTLAGLALAEAGLKRRSRLAIPALLLGANLPDIDGLSYLAGSGIDGLSFRRGWTHGVLAMVLLPLLLWAGLVGWNRLARGAREGIQHRWLLGLAAIAVWSHPLLDLLNVYGVRLLMPFSSRWFYGDALFIVDPWVWAALACGIVLTRRRAGDSDATGPRVTRPARIALGLCAGYALAMAVTSRFGEQVVERQLQPGAARRTLAAPVFGNPLHRRVIRELDGRYELGRLAIGRTWRYTPISTLSTGRADPGAEPAAATETGAAFLRWARFPMFESEPRDEGMRVTISDLRYGGPGNRTWASVTVFVLAGKQDP